MKSITEVIQNLLKPYIDKNIETATGVLGAKNLLPNEGTTQIINGVTFTVNSDGTVTVSTGSGGATSLTQFILFEDVANWHNMILSGAPSTASATTYDLATYDTQTSGENSCRPNEVVLTNMTDGHTIRVFIRVRSGQVITTPITFKPMIRPASIADDTYVPYAMTNRELTKDKVSFNTRAENISTITLSGTSATYTTTEDGTYSFIFTNNTNAAHDMTISMSGVSIERQYATHQYMRLNCIIALKAGVTITFYGAANDSVAIQKIY